MSLNNVVINSCCLQTLYDLFSSKPTEATLPSHLNAQIINALYDYQPAPEDTQPTLAWLAVMQEAYCNLAL
jgi:ribosomal RNA-processing protein 12